MRTCWTCTLAPVRWAWRRSPTGRAPWCSWNAIRGSFPRSGSGCGWRRGRSGRRSGALMSGARCGIWPRGDSASISSCSTRPTAAASCRRRWTRWPLARCCVRARGLSPRGTGGKNRVRRRGSSASARPATGRRGCGSSACSRNLAGAAKRRPTVTTAIYPGSFDPAHNGHLDVIQRAAALFGRVVVALAQETRKDGLFPVDERAAMLRDATKHIRGVEVRLYAGLTVAFARRVGADVIVKGLRGVEDFEHELRQAVMNRRLGGLDTAFFMPSPPYAQISSTLIREVVRLGGDVSAFVPSSVARRLPAPGGGEGRRRATDEARRVIMEAEAHARRLVDESPVRTEAERRKAQLLAEAEEEAARIRRGAEEYASRVLADLAAQLSRILDVVQRGKTMLETSKR